MAEIILVTGGARSGKSAFAERRVAAMAEQVGYIATAQAWDEEMRLRIEIHQQRRPAGWQTFEAPRQAAAVLAKAAAETKAILFDCLTMFVTNCMCQEDFPADPEDGQRYIARETEALLRAAQQATCPVVFVTNEVGLGIVPDNAMSRAFRDYAGWVNQQVASQAQQVFLVVSGLAVDVRRLAEAE